MSLRDKPPPIRCDGTVLFDCHAEVIARRAFVRSEMCYMHHIKNYIGLIVKYMMQMLAVNMLWIIERSFLCFLFGLKI